MVDFEKSLTYLFAQVANAQRASLEKAMNACGLHSGQIFVIISLWQIDGQSQIDLVKNLNVSPPTVYKMVLSLTTNGFVYCRKCVRDGRMMRVYLTKKGRECQNLVEEQWLRTEDSFFSNLTATEKLIFSQILQKSRDNSSGGNVG